MDREPLVPWPLRIETCMPMGSALPGFDTTDWNVSVRTGKQWKGSAGVHLLTKGDGAHPTNYFWAPEAPKWLEKCLNRKAISASHNTLPNLPNQIAQKNVTLFLLTHTFIQRRVWVNRSSMIVFLTHTTKCGGVLDIAKHKHQPHPNHQLVWQPCWVASEVVHSSHGPQRRWQAWP